MAPSRPREQIDLIVGPRNSVHVELPTETVPGRSRQSGCGVRFPVKDEEMKLRPTGHLVPYPASPSTRAHRSSRRDGRRSDSGGRKTSARNGGVRRRRAAAAKAVARGYDAAFCKRRAVFDGEGPPEIRPELGDRADLASLGLHVMQRPAHPARAAFDHAGLVTAVQVVAKKALASRGGRSLHRMVRENKTHYRLAGVYRTWVFAIASGPLTKGSRRIPTYPDRRAARRSTRS